MFGLGVPEILVIAIIILLIFGAKRLPSIGEGLGKTVKELRNIKKEVKSEGQTEEKKQIEGGESSMEAEKKPSEAESKPSEETKNQPTDDASSEGDLADALQKKVTKKVTDTVLGQVPGLKQAKQLKDKADKIKKFVS